VTKPATFSTNMSSMYQRTMPAITNTHYDEIYWSLACYPLHIDRSQSIASLRATNNFFLYEHRYTVIGKWFLSCPDMIIHDPDLGCYAVKEAEVQ